MARQSEDEYVTSELIKQGETRQLCFHNIETKGLAYELRKHIYRFVLSTSRFKITHKGHDEILEEIDATFYGLGTYQDWTAAQEAWWDATNFAADLQLPSWPSAPAAAIAKRPEVFDPHV